MTNRVKLVHNDLSTHRSRVAASQGRIRGDIGQAMVELALIFPIFILLLLGAAEFGRLAYAAIEISNAARAGASYGSLSHITASDYTNIELAATTDAANVAGVTAVATNSCACSTGVALTCSTALLNCPAPARIIEYVTVTTSGTVDPLFHYPGLPRTFTLTGRATMRVEQ